MKESSDILDKIELYTKGRMRLEEKLAFENELATDESVREQFEFSKIVDQMIIGNEAWNLKEQMQKDLYKPKLNVGKYLTISLFALLASAGLFFVFNKKEDKPQVTIPTSATPKTIVQAEKQAEPQKMTVPASTKKVVNQEKRTNVNTSTSLPEITAVSVQQSMVQPSVQSSPVQSAGSAKALNESPKTVVSKTDPCASLVGEVEFYTLPSCKGQETGEVHLKVETVKGGLSPFTFKLGEKSAKANFNGLASGQYSLFIKDANNCLVENGKKVIVGEKKCAEKKEYVFNPEYDPSWPIPYDNDKVAVNFKVLEKSGKPFFQTSVSASQPIEWRGESNTGLVLGMGLYFFTIEYADGSVDEGSIVVTR